MKRFLFAALYLSHILCFSQVKTPEEMRKEFEQFKQQQTDSFNTFKDEQNKEFADFLKKQWEQFDMVQGIAPPTKLKPVEQPVNVPPEIEHPDKDKLPNAMLFG